MLTGKHFGLKKLNLITKGMQGVKVSPHFVLKNPEQYRPEMAKGKPRLLVRTDEKGRTYKTLEWVWMPRFDEQAHISGRQLKDRIENEIKIRNEKDIDPNKRKYALNKLLTLIHPTRKREDLASTGIVFIMNGIGAGIEIYPNPPKHKQVHRDLDFKLTFGAVKGKNGKYYIPKRELEGYPLDRNTLLLIRRLLRVLNKGVTQKQIKERRSSTSISFVTWKDKPSELELFDLQEARATPEKRQQKLPM